MKTEVRKLIRKEKNTTNVVGDMQYLL